MGAETTGTTQPATTTQSAENTQNAGGQQAAQQAQSKTFTQEQLDAIIADRLTRERAKFADYDELKKSVQVAEDAKKSELEKAADRASKAEAEAARIKAESTQRMLNSEARAVAAELGFVEPAIAAKLADLSKVVKDGELDSAALRTQMEALAKASPYLLGKPAAPGTGATNPPKGGAPSGKETDEQRRARLRGGAGFTEWTQSGGALITGSGPTVVSTDK
jgi:hypothetical protein